jgi:hypothetical protein
MRELWQLHPPRLPDALRLLGPQYRQNFTDKCVKVSPLEYGLTDS